MEILWLGQSCFRLRNQAATAVLTDPYQTESDDNPQARLLAGVRLATFSQRDTGKASPVASDPNVRRIEAPGEYELHSIMIRGAMTQLGAGQTRADRNVAYSITLDGVTVCHLGRIRTALTPLQIDSLGPADILLTPVAGEGGGLAPREAVQMAQHLSAKMIIPMLHEDSPAAVSEWIRNAGGDPEATSQQRLSVTRNNLPENIQTVLMSPQTAANGRR